MFVKWVAVELSESEDSNLVIYYGKLIATSYPHFTLWFFTSVKINGQGQCCCPVAKAAAHNTNIPNLRTGSSSSCPDPNPASYECVWEAVEDSQELGPPASSWLQVVPHPALGGKCMRVCPILSAFQKYKLCFVLNQQTKIL